MNPRRASTQAVSDYREFPVPIELAAHFLCFWTQSIVGPPGEYGHWVLPDACIDIVFINHVPPVLVGPWTDPFEVRLAAGTKIVGARWHPGRSASLLGVPAAELRNRSVQVSDVWRKKNSCFARISDAPNLAGRMSLLDEALLAAVASAAPFDRAVDAGIRWLARHPHGRVEQLSQRLGVSTRQMQRRFTAAVGYGPKMFQSVLRFQRVLNLAGRRYTHQSLAQLAADAGYADQAHMTREVQRFANCPPSTLLRTAVCTLGMSDLFKTRDASPNYL
jgi:AraC-like DNA-binding protein